MLTGESEHNFQQDYYCSSEENTCDDALEDENDFSGGGEEIEEENFVSAQKLFEIQIMFDRSLEKVFGKTANKPSKTQTSKKSGTYSQTHYSI